MRRTKHGGDSRLFFDWLEIAAQDLLAAKLLCEDNQCLEVASFHCQQCIEKTLKAYLIHKTGILVDGHNLTWLCKQAEKQDPFFHRFMDSTIQMNRLYIETRYPSDRELSVSPAQAASFYATAESLYERVCSEIYGEGDSSD